MLALHSGLPLGVVRRMSTLSSSCQGSTLTVCPDVLATCCNEVDTEVAAAISYPYALAVSDTESVIVGLSVVHLPTAVQGLLRAASCTQAGSVHGRGSVHACSKLSSQSALFSMRAATAQCGYCAVLAGTLVGTQQGSLIGPPLVSELPVTCIFSVPFGAWCLSCNLQTAGGSSALLCVQQ